MWQTEIGYYGSYFALLLLPLKTWKSEFKKTTNKKWWRYLPFTHLNQKPQSYEAQLLNYRVKQTEFIFILGHFLPFTGVPLTTQKIRILRKWKCHIFLHLCTKNHYFMTYASWEMECNRHNFLSFCWTFTPRLTLKQKFGKNEKNTWRYYPFTHVYHEWRSYDAWFLRYGAWQVEFSHFGLFFALWPS